MSIAVSANSQGYLMLAGGGSESSSSGSWSHQPYSWFVEKANGQPIVVLSNSDTSTWIPNYFTQLGATSVTNLTITGNSEAAILEALESAGGVFLKGGNQQHYLNAWLGTPVSGAIRAVFDDGGVIGGTSAGAMVAGTFISSNSLSRGPTSDENLRNPFNQYNQIQTGFLDLLPNAIVDTHYFERGRPGRLLGMLGRISTEHDPETLIGIGVDDRTAVLVDPDGNLTVSGSGGVHVFRMMDATVFHAQPNEDLSISGLGFHQLTHGFKINLSTGEILEMPGDATEIPAFETEGPGVAITFSKNGWPQSYLNEINPEDSPDDLWVVLNGGAVGINPLLNFRDNIETVAFDAGLIDDHAYVSPLFSGKRLFVNVQPSNWLALMGSEAFKTGMESGGVKMELLLRHLQTFGDGFVTNASAHPYTSYDGLLKSSEGTGFFAGFVSVDSTYTSADHAENRTSAVGWLMNKYQSSTGLATSGLTRISYLNGGFVFDRQQISSVIFDGREGYFTATSPFVMSSQSGQTRNAAAISKGFVHVVSEGGGFTLYDATGTATPGTGREMPSAFRLHPAYPNPFNPTTALVIEAVEPANINMEIFDYVGRRVMQLERKKLQAGANHIPIDMSGFGSGVYFVRVSGQGIVKTTAITLIK